MSQRKRQSTGVGRERAVRFIVRNYRAADVPTLLLSALAVDICSATSLEADRFTVSA
jgi:hypothetical protein